LFLIYFNLFLLKNKEILEEYLKNKKIPHEFFEYDDVSSSDKAGKIVPIEKIGKTIVFVNEKGEPIIILIRAIYKVHQKELAKKLGFKDIRLATPEEVVKFTGYEIGGVSPFYIDYPLFIDKDLLNEEIIYVGGGDKKHLLKVRVEDIIKNNKTIIMEIPKKV